ncbi:MAG: DUF4160 domain-containing protein [Anaerolineae bacterium]|nr:DUF4160 domain-containing protein [Anaerolineae bacterium]
MPTVLLLRGWRVYFFANESNEPMHVHCRKGSALGKFWILPDTYEIQTAYVRRMTHHEEREIRKILFEHLDEIVIAWAAFQEKR